MKAPSKQRLLIFEKQIEFLCCQSSSKFFFRRVYLLHYFSTLIACLFLPPSEQKKILSYIHFFPTALGTRCRLPNNYNEKQYLNNFETPPQIFLKYFFPWSLQQHLSACLTCTYSHGNGPPTHTRKRKLKQLPARQLKASA